MIEWMQKHKKWLIVTIWISTIAFVGAGFVGWGSYDYGKSNSTVAIVGEKEVPLKDLENEYSNLYSQYRNMLGDSFNKELAEQFKLEDIALQRVIQRYLILNYADDLGLIATDKEIALELVQINAFFKDGKFDKQTYVSALKQSRRTVAEFEAQLTQDILVNKIQNLFQTSLKPNELENLSTLIFSEDQVSLSIINDENIKIKYTENILKEYWSKNKDNYKSPSGFEIIYNKIENIENKTKKEMRKVALKAYLNLKKEKEVFKSKKTLYTSSTFLDADDLKTVTTSKIGTVLKPIYKDTHYYVIKLVKKVSPQVLQYKDITAQVKSDYTQDEKSKLLEKQATAIMKNFKGKDIGYISRNSITLIKGLNNSENEEFIKHLFSATKPLNKVTIGSKVVIYKITNSKFTTYDSTKNQSVTQSIENLKASSLSSSLLKKLANKYEVQSFMGNK